MKQVEMNEEDHRRLSAVLRKVEFFAGLTVADIGKLFCYIQKFGFEKGEFVFKKGGPADALYIIADGRAVVKSKNLFFLPSKPISYLGSGSFFGEMALLDRKPRSADVQAIEPTSVYVLLTSDFDRVVEQNSTFAKEMAAIAERRKFQNLRNQP